MRLHTTLRKHYTKKGNKWVPKKKFKSPEEVREQLGFDLNMCDIYPCTECNYLHISKVRK